MTVQAENTSTMDATATSKIESWDDVSLVLVFNSIGWKSSNLLFNLIDAIIGDPLISSAFNGEQPSEAIAYIRDSNVHAAGNLAVTAAQAAQITAVGGNENVADAEVDIAIGSKAQAKGVVGRRGRRVEQGRHEGAGVHRVHRRARHDRGRRRARLRLRLCGHHRSTSTVIQVSIVSNTLTGLTDYVAQFADDDYDYTTRSGVVTVQPGRTTSRGRASASPPTTASRRATPAASTSTAAPCRSRSTSATVDFKAIPTLWEKVVLTTDEQLDNFYPNIGNISDSNSRAIGILIVLNDVRADVSAWIDNADVTAGSVEVLATEEAQIAAEATSTVTASGGSLSGGGTVQAINGQIATNVVLLEGARVDRGQRHRRHRRRRRRGAQHLRDRRVGRTSRRPPATSPSASRSRSTRSAGRRRTSSSTRSTPSSATR